jgi:hypothetical protein
MHRYTTGPQPDESRPDARFFYSGVQQKVMIASGSTHDFCRGGDLAPLSRDLRIIGDSCAGYRTLHCAKAI